MPSPPPKPLPAPGPPPPSKKNASIIKSIQNLLIFALTMALIEWIFDPFQYYTVKTCHDKTLELKYRMMIRATQITFNVYPGHSKMLEKVAIVEKHLDTFQSKLDTYQQFYKEHGYINGTMRKEALHYTYGVLDNDLTLNIFNTRNDIERFWVSYYWDEYSWYRDFIENKTCIDRKPLQYFWEMNKYSEAAFESQMYKFALNIQNRHWALMWDVLDLCRYITKEEIDKGNKSIGKRSFTRRDFYSIRHIFVKTVELKCFFKRNEVTPYSHLIKDFWGIDGSYYNNRPAFVLQRGNNAPLQNILQYYK